MANMSETLKRIWAATLSLDVGEIGDDDNLFELGGDSVKAILIIGEAASHGIYFDIETFYANPTVAGISALLSSGYNSQKPNGDRIEAEQTGGANYTVYNIPASCFESLGIPTTEVSKVAPTDPDQDFYFSESAKGVPGSTVSFVYEMKGPSLLEKLQRAVDLLSIKNPALRSTFIQVEDTYYQVLLKTGNTKIVHHSEDIKEFLTHSVKRIVHPGDSVTQYALVQNHGKTFFVFSILHSFFDAFSRTILERDLLDALKSPELFLEQAERLWYGDFVAHKQKTLDKQANSAFWATYLGNACLETFYEGKPKQRHTFDSSLRETLPNTLVQGRSIHIATAVLTAWSLTLMSESGQRDVAFAIVALGRLYPYEGIERTIGLFVRDRIFRLRATSDEVDIGSLRGSVQEDLVSTGTQEHGKVAGILPGIDGAPVAQSYINVKAGGSKLENQSINGLVLTPRRDMEHWTFSTRYAIYIEMWVSDDGYVFEMRYQSTLVPLARAQRLFAAFIKTLKLVVGSDDGMKLGDFVL